MIFQHRPRSTMPSAQRLPGSQHASKMPVASDFNTAPFGLSECRCARLPAYNVTTQNCPEGANNRGVIETLSSQGAETDGNRHLTGPLAEGEIVWLIFTDTPGQVFTRSGMGPNALNPWVKRW